MLRVGIVGLPNVGKSTLFNALTKQAAESANFPFTTIEPNVGVVTVPDERLNKLAEISKSEKIVPTTIEFVDIAGLVEGAHKGEGLGNQFLSHIREVDAIVHVVRFFEDGEITHVANKVDPKADVETIKTELALSDLQTVSNALSQTEKEISGPDSKELKRANSLKNIENHLSGKTGPDFEFEEEERQLIKELNLLSGIPTLYIANLSENQIKNAKAVIKDFSETNNPVLPVSIKIEQELVELSQEDRQEYLKEYGLNDTGLNRLIQESYKLLCLITFFTSGPQESRAWTVTNGSLAPHAAGKIHTDIERGFIRAETVSYQDLVAADSYADARSAGKVRDEGKEYVVIDGDIMLFKFSV